MDLYGLGEIVATRKLAIGLREGAIEVLIGRPSPFPDSEDFFVPYQIIGIGDESIRYAGGIDSVQCIQLAMAKIGYELEAINESLGRTLRWEGDETGNLGFFA